MNYLTVIVFIFSIILFDRNLVSAEVSEIIDPLEQKIKRDEKSVLPIVLQKIENIFSFGASQVTKAGLEEIMHQNRILPEHFIDVDLRGEPHLFINGRPVYLKPIKFTDVKELMNYEKNLADDINSGKVRSLSVREKTKYIEKNKEEGNKKKFVYKSLEIELGAVAETEAQIAQQLGIKYIRIPNAEYVSPSLETAYLFIRSVTPYFRNAVNVFLLHCNAGHGRTTVYAIILDMLLNGTKDSLQTIIKRQAKTFSSSILRQNMKSLNKQVLLRHIYDYIHTNEDNFVTPPAPLLLPYS